ncbi:hypothetical protein I6I45_05610 [Pseudomonas fluorescens]|uniref:Uncharacterized protein n=1 Tax=Pseudomonas lactis TaxID=1615674 RepID=A0A7Y1M1M0_9PSED|nr:hypothetical protein [Pseudomonas lactis]NNA82070.1 hypothetical protein [Pseudomonas lactis]QQU69471.1 hypothetical protein I6I45_05610 [Pseudomonas fluorescens]
MTSSSRCSVHEDCNDFGLSLSLHQTQIADSRASRSSWK